MVYPETPNRGVPTVITDLNGNKRVVYVQQAQQLQKKVAPTQVISGPTVVQQQQPQQVAFRDSAHKQVYSGQQQFLSPSTAQRYVKKL